MNCIENNEYYLNWTDHMNHVRRTLTSLLAQNELVDVTLCCEGGKLFAHKMLLSICSHFFLEAFKENPCPHPIVILKGVNCKQMKDLLKFMYDGEVILEPDDFESFLKTAKLLEVYGLTECEGIDGYTQNTVKMKPDVANNTQHITDMKNEIAAEIISIDNAHIKAEGSTRLENIGGDTDGYISETIQTFDLSEVQISPQYGSSKFLELQDATTEILQDEPSEVSLHYHRCFSSTAPTVKPKLNTEAESSNSKIRKLKFNKSADRRKCSVCAKTFTHVNSLRQHMKVHTEGAKCSVCGKMLCRRYQLKVHLKKQHGIDFVPKEQVESQQVFYEVQENLSDDNLGTL